MVTTPRRSMRRGQPGARPGRPRGSSRGFTLIELLLVLALMGLLLSIVAPRTIDHIERARETTLRATLKEVRHALDQFEADKGRPATNLDELITLRYLRELPLDPITDRRDTWVTVSPADAHPTGAPPASPADAPSEGVADLHSGAEGSARDGTPYASW